MDADGAEDSLECSAMKPRELGPRPGLPPPCVHLPPEPIFEAVFPLAREMFSRSDSEVNPLASFFGVIVSPPKISIAIRDFMMQTVGILPIHNEANAAIPHNIQFWPRCGSGLLGKLSLAGGPEVPLNSRRPGRAAQAAQ